jgi:hypothetical protein
MHRPPDRSGIDAFALQLQLHGVQHMFGVDGLVGTWGLGNVAQSPEQEFVERRLKAFACGGELVPDLAATGLAIGFHETVGFEVA